MTPQRKERYEEFMAVSIEEAKQSLREGNKGFGAVLVKDDRIVDRAHDTEVTESDPTAHAEIKLIRSAAKRGHGKELEGFTLVSTHEPCPMCTGAIVWAKVSEIVYGTSIQQSMSLGRTVINLACEEIVAKAPSTARVWKGILADQCSRLYDSSVRELVRQFKDGGPAGWNRAGQELTAKRIAWFEDNKDMIDANLHGSDVKKAYQLILMRIGIDEGQAPIKEESEDRLVFHSQNQCPALDACEILGLDTKQVCKLHTEGATDAMVKMLNPRLRFTRDYSRLRPDSLFCEEIIELQR